MPPPEGDASTAGNRTLTFDSVLVGDWVESFTYRFERFSQPRENQCFTSETVILDGSFPALVHNYEFRIYMEASDRRSFANSFVALTSFVTDDPKQLTLTGTNTLYTNIDFGLCFFLPPPSLLVPRELLLHEAGFVRLQFVGTTIPTVTQPT